MTLAQNQLKSGMRTRNRVSLLALSAVTSFVIIACGGGGGGNVSDGGGAGGGGGTAGTFSSICADQTTKTSSVSQAAADALCPVGVVSTVTAPTYTDEKLTAFNQLNADRAACGFGKLQQNAKLDIAAQGHADWLAANPQVATTHVQTRTGRGVFTGAQFSDRAIGAGYLNASATNAVSFGEDIAVPSWGTALSCAVCANHASYGNTELSAVNGVRQLYATIYHLYGVLQGDRDGGIGVAIGNATNNSDTLYIKNVVIDSGTVTGWVGQSIPTDTVLTYPCQGITTTPVFGNEGPEPFPARGFTEYGQPIYVQSAPGTTVTLNLTSSSITPAGGSAVPTTIFNTAVDPLPSTDGRRVKSNQVFLVPTQRLLDNTTYTVVLNGTNTGMVTSANPTGAFTKTFTFNTVTNTTL